MKVEASNQYSLGIFLKLLNGGLFITMSFLISQVALKLHIAQVLFIRVLLGAVLCAICLKLIKQPLILSLSKKQVLAYLSRALANFLGMLAWVEALSAIGLNEATAIMYLTPIWTVLMAVVFFNEKWTYRYLIVIALNVLGLVVILWPSLNSFSLTGIIAAILSTILWSIYDIICKKQSSTEHCMAQTFYTFLASILVIAPVAFAIWEPIPREALNNLVITNILIAAISVINVTVLFLSFVYAPVTILAPFSYVRIIFAALISYMVYNIYPSWECFIGSFIILAANLYFFITKGNIEVK